MAYTARLAMHKRQFKACCSSTIKCSDLTNWQYLSTSYVHVGTVRFCQHKACCVQTQDASAIIICFIAYDALILK